MYNLIMYLCFCFQIYTSYIHDPIDAPNMYIKKHKQQIIQILIDIWLLWIYIYNHHLRIFKVYSISPNNVYNYDGFP